MANRNERLNRALTYAQLFMTDAVNQAKLHRSRNQDALCSAIVRQLATAAELVPTDASRRFAKAVAELDEAES